MPMEWPPVSNCSSDDGIPKLTGRLLAETGPFSFYEAAESGGGNGVDNAFRTREVLTADFRKGDRHTGSPLFFLWAAIMMIPLIQEGSLAPIRSSQSRPGVAG